MITFSPHGDIVFICKANVGRSQIAEALYNKYFGRQSKSFAGCEARKKTYGGVPLKELSEFLIEKYSLDISKNQVKYLKDFGNLSLKKAYFLYNPEQELCDEDCKLDEKTPYDLLKSLGIPLEIVDISDPFETGKKGYQKIYEDIQSFVKKIDV